MSKPPAREVWARPRALFDGAQVALVAPAGPLARDRIEASQDRCRTLGLEPVVTPSAAARQGFLAGPDEQRLEDLQTAFDDPSIDAVWALRGGYGTLRIVDDLSLERQRSDPIPFIGFSDNTTLHVRLSAQNAISFHGPHPGGDFPTETEEFFRRVLYEARPAGLLTGRPGDPAPVSLVGGVAEGPLWGGNLSILAALCGSTSRLTAAGRILILEEVGEPAYRVDRMLLQLTRAGVLDGMAGLAIGRFTETPEGEEKAVRDVLSEFADRSGVPAVADLPFGHVEHNSTLPLGTWARLDGDNAGLEILEAAVTAPRARSSKQ